MVGLERDQVTVQRPSTAVDAEGNISGGLVTVLSTRGTWGTASYTDLQRAASRGENIEAVVAIPSNPALTAVAAGNYRAAVLADSPVGYWRLGEQAGDAQDSSGYGREAVVNGGITRQQPGALYGDPDTAFKFNGSTGYLQAPAFAIAGPFSIEAFVKPGAYPGSAPTYNDFVIQRSGYNANGVIGQWTASNVFNFGASMYPGANAYFFSAVNRDPTLWWHLLLSYDPVLGAVLYINGLADVTRPDIVGVPSLGSQPWTMATGFYPAQTFSGCSLDEVAVYLSALSAGRAKAHYQASQPATGPAIRKGDRLTVKGVTYVVVSVQDVRHHLRVHLRERD